VAVVGEAAAGSQEGRVAPGGVSSPRGVVSCGGPDVSSDGGAPRHGSTAAFPANSAQGKDSWGFAEVSGRVFGVKGGRERSGRAATSSALHRELLLSPSLSAARGKGGQCSRAWGEGSGKS
jgi:hypothetical protein